MHRYLVLVLAFGTTLTAHPSLASPPTEARRYESLVCVEQDILPRVLIQNRTRQPVTLEQRMAELSVPGVSIAVIEEGAVAWARAYGLADIHGKIPVTTETLFQAASITKAISATAALDLVEDGLLDLDADVNDQLTLWKLKKQDDSVKGHATLRGLLSHSAGVTVPGFDGYGPKERVPTLIEILDGKAVRKWDGVEISILPESDSHFFVPADGAPFVFGVGVDGLRSIEASGLRFEEVGP